MEESSGRRPSVGCVHTNRDEDIGRASQHEQVSNAKRCDLRMVTVIAGA
ncbi:MAG: hypothetical protein IJN46_05760 [Lachnospiraceae bacterium]|nr:hypothetical protein [Lachnospiraceae bacterium]